MNVAFKHLKYSMALQAFLSWIPHASRRVRSNFIIALQELSRLFGGILISVLIPLYEENCKPWDVKETLANIPEECWVGTKLLPIVACCLLCLELSLIRSDFVAGVIWIMTYSLLWLWNSCAGIWSRFLQDENTIDIVAQLYSSPGGCNSSFSNARKDTVMSYQQKQPHSAHIVPQADSF